MEKRRYLKNVLSFFVINVILLFLFIIISNIIILSPNTNTKKNVSNNEISENKKINVDSNFLCSELNSLFKKYYKNNIDNSIIYDFKNQTIHLNRDHYVLDITSEDILNIACFIYTQANNESLDCKVEICNTLLNNSFKKGINLTQCIYNNKYIDNKTLQELKNLKTNSKCLESFFISLYNKNSNSYYFINTNNKNCNYSWINKNCLINKTIGNFEFYKDTTSNY